MILLITVLYYSCDSLRLFSFFLILAVLVVMLVLMFCWKRIGNTIQVFPIFFGFSAGFLLNKVFSAEYLANFTKWMIETNTGAFNPNDFIMSNVFLIFAFMLSLTFIFVIIPLNKITRTERAILVFFGFAVASLVLAGINSINYTFNWLSMVAYAEHWKDRVTFDSSVILDIVKSLFFAGLFNVLERLVRMKREI